MEREALDLIAKKTLDAAFRVHNVLGPGLLESAYKACLAIELEEAGLFVEVEPPVPLIYRGRKISDVGYRMDLLVGRELILEIKSVEALHPIHHAQLLSYLRLADKRLGLLMNFNTVKLRDGIKRIANQF
ncbi:GxxExxY protein [Granulicella sp. 5B5]|uniref:GxxExxY protein n=1 Tax=Granulicella sp. 5B5 TaxID=1617967 RepID=UPI0015F62D10|nr:GxxExxY protein [Granulicella sp. 5B5]QMV19494.1 GxxExxY protein [Granulicella sp. 5B5]